MDEELQETPAQIFTRVEKLRSMQLPPESSEQLNQLIKNNRISYDDFIEQLNQIYEAGNSYNWKITCFFNTLKETILIPLKTYSTFELFIFFIALVLLLLLDKKYQIIRIIFKILIHNLKAIIQAIPKIIYSCLLRFFCVAIYIFPIMNIYVLYMPVLLVKIKTAVYLCPNFMRIAMQLWQLHPDILMNGFFLVAMFLLGKRLPRPRIFRFHMARSLMISVFQGFLGHNYISLMDSYYKGFETEGSLIDFAIFGIVLNFWWILPSLWQAVTLSYPRNAFIREAVEVILGRDDFDEGFQWWDRKKKKK
jgi:hypothetical protein